MRRSVVRFYVLALAISWAGWIPFAASRAGLVGFVVPWEIPLLAQFGPSAAAFLLVFRREGRDGARRLLDQGLRWRLPVRWWAVALLTVPGMALGWILVHALLGHPVPGWDALARWPARYAETFGGGGVYAIDSTPHPSLGPIALLRRLVRASPWLALANFVVFSLVTGPVSEEFGWRGWLLPRLQDRVSPLRASLVVGLLWGFWHTGPDFWRILLEGDPRAFLYPAAMTLGTLPLSVLSTWLYNGTGSSLLPSMLLHASFNATLSVLGLVWTSRSPLLVGGELVLGLWVVAAVLALRHGGRLLGGRRGTPANAPA